MALSAIEEVYFQAWGKAGGSARVCRAFSMSNFIWSMLECQARNKNPGITDRVVSWHAAKHVGEKIPGELSRSTRREIAPGLIAPVVSKEDAILAKLHWIQQGSHRSRHDVTEMLRREEDIDHETLKRRAATLGLLDLLAEMENEMRAGPGLS
jgi:hypothetical protein